MGKGLTELALVMCPYLSWTLGGVELLPTSLGVSSTWSAWQGCPWRKWVCPQKEGHGVLVGKMKQKPCTAYITSKS